VVVYLVVLVAVYLVVLVAVAVYLVVLVAALGNRCPTFLRIRSRPAATYAATAPKTPPWPPPRPTKPKTASERDAAGGFSRVRSAYEASPRGRNPAYEAAPTRINRPTARKHCRRREIKPKIPAAVMIFFAGYFYVGRRRMSTHPFRYWPLASGCLVIVLALQLACKSSKEIGGSTIRAMTGVPADKILDLDPLQWKLDRCERHGLVMTEAIVPLKGGNDRAEDFDRDYLVASVELFPHAEDPFLWGSFPPPHAETHARVRHCSKCIEIKADWLKVHPNVDECGQPRRTSR
jgi:hypothetical protein